MMTRRHNTPLASSSALPVPRRATMKDSPLSSRKQMNDSNDFTFLPPLQSPQSRIENNPVKQVFSYHGIIYVETFRFRYTLNQILEAVEDQGPSQCQPNDKHMLESRRGDLAWQNRSDFSINTNHMGLL